MDAAAKGRCACLAWCRSQDSNYSNALQTVKVIDTRPLTGDTLQNPRIIGSLPFVDVDDSSRFLDTYTFDSGDPKGVSAFVVLHAGFWSL